MDTNGHGRPVEKGDSQRSEADRPPTCQSSSDGQAEPKSRRDRLEWWTELIAVVILSIATLGVAWSGYQSARWSGVQSTSYAEAGGRRVESSRASARANTETMVDVSVFTSWLDAFARGDTELANFISERFRPEFQTAFIAWLASKPVYDPNAPPTPFAMPEYQLASQQEADRLEQEANALLEQGKAANQQSDDYVLNTVILVSVLFFAGIAQRRFRRLEYRVALTALGSGMLIYGLVHIFTYPVQ
jgi:hypothetical protein